MGVKTFTIGIDPGLNGAFAVYCIKSKKLIDVYDMPTFIVKASKNKIKRELAIYKLNEIICPFKHQLIGAVIEHVGACPNQGVSSTFKFGFVTGVIHGFFASQNIPIHLIRPSIWKGILGLTACKNEARLLASKMFKNHIDKFKRSKDDGRAESALIASLSDRFFKPME